MKINLKVRMKNPVFWLTIIPALISCIYTILGLFDVVPSIGGDVLEDGLISLVTVLTTMGVLVDPTTKGVGDSERAIEYTEPQ